MIKDILNQEHLFKNLRDDEIESFNEDFTYTYNIDNITYIYDSINLFDITYGYNRYIKLSEILVSTDYNSFTKLQNEVKKCNSITIINDFKMENNELDYIIKFYLSIFYLNFSKVCLNCYIYA